MSTNFYKFVTDEKILEILIKERSKLLGDAKQVSRENSLAYKQLNGLLPSRRTWVTPGQEERSKLTNDRTRKLRNAQIALRTTIKRDREAFTRPAYFQKLAAFATDIKESVKSGNITLVPPVTTALFKKAEEHEDKIVAVFRPISVYDDLKTKVLLKLAGEFLSNLLDPLFHEEILSYRKRRKYHGGEPKVTKAEDAIPNILQFKQEHPQVWVAECDIKQFYDIVNHNEVRKALDRLLDKGKIDRVKASGALTILEKYIDSYNFKESVLEKSQEPEFWDKYKKHLPKKVKYGRKPVECVFGWVDESELPDDYHQIGIPQGGVLSTLICNILMNDVDRAIIGNPDPDRMFNRFGDDIILMHSSEEGCRRYFDAYKESLTAHKLIYHDEKSVKDYKDGALTLPGYWDEKTKAPFRWGPGEGNAADWIGFVGYEVRSNGEIRLRKSTLNKQFAKICFRYNQLKHMDEPIKTSIPTVMRAIDRIGWSILRFGQLDFNPASRMQMHRLDRYRHNKINKARKHLETLPIVSSDKEWKDPVKQPSSYASVLASKKDK